MKKAIGFHNITQKGQDDDETAEREGSLYQKSGHSVEDATGDGHSAGEHSNDDKVHEPLKEISGHHNIQPAYQINDESDPQEGTSWHMYENILSNTILRDREYNIGDASEEDVVFQEEIAKIIQDELMESKKEFIMKGSTGLHTLNRSRTSVITTAGSKEDCTLNIRDKDETTTELGMGDTVCEDKGKIDSDKEDLSDATSDKEKLNEVKCADIKAHNVLFTLDFEQTLTKLAACKDKLFEMEDIQVKSSNHELNTQVTGETANDDSTTKGRNRCKKNIRVRFPDTELDDIENTNAYYKGYATPPLKSPHNEQNNAEMDNKSETPLVSKPETPLTPELPRRNPNKELIRMLDFADIEQPRIDKNVETFDFLQIGEKLSESIHDNERGGYVLKKNEPKEPKEKEEVIIEKAETTAQVDNIVPSSTHIFVDAKYDIMTGFFYDRMRRADLVLVMPLIHDPQVLVMREALLIQIAKAGIDIEAETGTLPENEDVQFVKLHATDAFLANTTADSRKHFRRLHEMIIRKSKPYPPCVGFKYEADWLHNVRKHYSRPLELSNLERSYAVYMAIRTYSFEDGSGFGLSRLMKRKLISDVYALHDGPYYSHKEKKYEVYNCRQVLFLTWIGIPNFFCKQPLNLINEYFGPKIAFYFAFYEFYINSLIPASLWGIIMTVVYFTNDSAMNTYMRMFVCGLSYREVPEKPISYHVTICPECEQPVKETLCPMSMTDHYCKDLQALRVFESTYMIVYSLGMILWGFIFLKQWKRTESYHRWLWEEYNNTERDIVRTESNFPAKRFELTLLMKIIRWLQTTAVRKIMNFTVGSLIILVIIILTYIKIYEIYNLTRPLSVTLKLKEKDMWGETIGMVPEIDKSIESIVFFTTAGIASVVHYIFETIFLKIYQIVAKFENHKRQINYENSLIVKSFFCSFCFSVVVLTLIAWFKALFWTSPNYLWYLNIKYPMGKTNLTAVSPDLRQRIVQIMTYNCGPFGCLIQAFFVYIVMFLVRCIMDQARRCIFRYVSEVRWRGKAVPTVERERPLMKITTELLVDDYNSIMIQLALILLFAPLCPLLPILGLIYGFFDIRHRASVCLLRSRRPVLFKASGIGKWNDILKIICLLAPFTQAVTISRTNIFKRYVFFKFNEMRSDFWSTLPEDYQKFISFMLHDNINVKEFGKVIYKEAKNYFNNANCRADEYYYHYADYPVIPTMGKSKAIPEMYSLLYYKTVFIIVYMNVCLVLGLLVWFYCRSCPLEVKRFVQRERNLRRLYWMRVWPPPHSSASRN